MGLKRKRHLRLLPEPAELVAYGVIGFEEYDRKKYYVACEIFPTAMGALHYRGAARELHGYSAYEEYYAVAIYGDGRLEELRYTSLSSYLVDSSSFQRQHPTVARNLFSSLLARGFSTPMLAEQ